MISQMLKKRSTNALEAQIFNKIVTTLKTLGIFFASIQNFLFYSIFSNFYDSMISPRKLRFRTKNNSLINDQQLFYFSVTKTFYSRKPSVKKVEITISTNFSLQQLSQLDPNFIG
jgi:hypothetical protein